MGIGETIFGDLAKIILRATGEKANKACGNLHLCAGLEAGIEGENHAVEERRRERGYQGAVVEEEQGEGTGDEAEDYMGNIGADRAENTRGEGNLTTVVDRMGVEVVTNLAAVMGMKVEGGVDKVEGEGGGYMLAMEATELLTQEVDLVSTALVDACNEFNDMRRLAMLWMVRHRWAVGERFALNCYKIGHIFSYYR